jgi:hypothetical protein
MLKITISQLTIHYSPFTILPPTKCVKKFIIKINCLFDLEIPLNEFLKYTYHEDIERFTEAPITGFV